MASYQEFINTTEAIKDITAEDIIYRNLPGKLRSDILTQLPQDEEITESYKQLTSVNSAVHARHLHLLSLGYAAATPTASGYPPVTPANDGAVWFVEAIVGHLAASDQNRALIISFVKALLDGEVEEEEEVEGGRQPPSHRGARGGRRVSVASSVPARGSRSDAGPGKRFYCHECGAKHQFRRDMKRHFKKHFPGHEVDVLDQEWEEDHGRWGPWTEVEAVALGRDLKSMREQ